MAKKDIGYPDNETKLGPSGNIDNEDMGRNADEVVQATLGYSKTQCGIDLNSENGRLLLIVLAQAFKAGVEWADEHPKCCLNNLI